MSRIPPSLKSIADTATANRPRYFDDPATDELLAILLELAEENCVLRDRLTTAEILHEGLQEAIAQYQLSSEETSSRLSAHSDYMNDLMECVVALIRNS